ncbi:MAG: T9SS type A sorting domain-containing protein, partial [Bacteroidota bacterium]|nr:T9SS type A sorting domain-containing protein [Bacteroidota bacterium]
GQGGYFNVQHDFGVNWALSVEMADGGAGTLTYDNPTQSVSFSFPQDQWFEIVMDIDMQDANDEITLTINDVVVHTWMFSLSQSAGGPMKVLDCINFYGYPDVSPPYYVDDFKFIQTAAPIEHPELELSDAAFEVDGLTNETLTLTNTGEEEMTFEALVYYPAPDPVKSVSNSTVAANSTQKTVRLNSLSFEKMDKVIEVNLDPKDENLTHLTGDVGGSLGWGGTSNVDAQATALFKYDNNATAGVDLKDYIGMEISTVIIMAGDAPVGESTVEIFAGRDGYTNGPKDAAVYTQGFTAVGGGQAPVLLTDPVFVSGKDMFVGWSFTQAVGEHCVSMDAGPPADDANWTNTGVAWSEVSNPDFGNFGIVAVLTGTPIHQWLTLDMTEGTVDAYGGTQDIGLQFDITGMDAGDYTSTVAVKTNDNDDGEAFNEIPVTLTVAVGVEGTEKVSIATYPNPVNSEFTINSSEEIMNVTAFDISGKEVLSLHINGKMKTIDTSNLTSGVYIFKINTLSQTVTRRIVVE